MEQHKGKSRIELIIESLAERVYCQHEFIHNHNKSISLLIFFISKSICFCFLIFNRKINFIDAHSWMKNPVFFFEIILRILYSLFNNQHLFIFLKTMWIRKLFTSKRVLFYYYFCIKNMICLLFWFCEIILN